MQERKQITISNQTLTILSSNQVTSLKELFKELQGDHNNSICVLLSGYHNEEKGTVYSFEIEENTLTLDQSGEGKFFLTYIVNYYEGCKDRNYDDDNNSMEITININLSNGTAILIGEDRPERGPDIY